MIRYEIDGESHVVLTQMDFYPPSDGRRYESGIDGATYDDTYYDYAKMLWSRHGEDLYDDPLSYRFDVAITDKVICRNLYRYL